MRRVALMLLALFFDAAGATAQRANERLPLRGVVRDAITRAPVNVATVHLIAPSGSVVAAATTSNDGAFRIEVPTPGRFGLRIRRLGYESSDTTLIFHDDSSTPVVFLISPSSMLLDSLLVIGRADRQVGATEQLLHGRLLDDNTRDPIASATVKLLRADGSVAATTITNNYGLFRLRAPMPGSYTIRGERIGYFTADSKPIYTMPRDTIRLDFFLSVSAVLLEPITVTASTRPWANRYPLTGMEDFFKRMGRWKTSGYFLQRDTLVWAARRGLTTSQMIEELAQRTPRGCLGDRIQFWANGAPYVLSGPTEREQFDQLNDHFPPMSLEAVELYIAPPIPGEFMNHPEAGSSRFPCKIVSLWSRRQPSRN